MTRLQLKESVRINLADLGVTFYQEDDLNDSIQDAYDDVALLTRCITKTRQMLFESDLVYYNLDSLLSGDYLGTIAIFNHTINLWLGDDISLKDMDNVRRDWELWTGTPQNWCPVDPKRIAIVPHYTGITPSWSGAFYYNAFSNAFYIGSASTPSFTLYYTAEAPTLSADSDTFLIATDMQDLLEFYTTADMLEQAQEFTKAIVWWSKYYPMIDTYSERVRLNAKSDLLLRV